MSPDEADTVVAGERSPPTQRADEPRRARSRPTMRRAGEQTAVTMAGTSAGGAAAPETHGSTGDERAEADDAGGPESS